MANPDTSGSTWRKRIARTTRKQAEAHTRVLAAPVPTEYVPAERRGIERSKMRGERMAKAALRIARGDYAEAVALLARRCHPSQAHTLARTILIAAGVLDTRYNPRRTP